jgi:hypothetical protein
MGDQGRVKKLWVLPLAAVTALGLGVPMASAATTTAPRKFTAELRDPKPVGAETMNVQFYDLDGKWYTYRCQIRTEGASVTSTGDQAFVITTRKTCTSRTSAVKRRIKVWMNLPAHRTPSLSVRINGFSPAPKTAYTFSCGSARLEHTNTASYTGTRLTSIGRCSASTEK